MCVRPLFDGNVDGKVTTWPTGWALIMPVAAVGVAMVLSVAVALVVDVDVDVVLPMAAKASSF